MSKYGWERGEIKMSVKEFRSFRLGMIAFYNGRQDEFFASAQAVYTKLKNAGKGKRNFDFHFAFDLAMSGASDLTNTDPGYYNQQMSRRQACDVTGYDEIKDALFPYESTAHFTGRSRKPKAPKKSAFAHAKQNAEGIKVGSEAGIGFDKKRRVVTWSVAENNHSVDRAHDHPVGREFFSRLSKIEWTRGTGGEIVGNDEYNEESRESGGGANYVTHSYRMLSKKEKAERARNAYSPYSTNPYRGWNTRRGF